MVKFVKYNYKKILFTLVIIITIPIYTTNLSEQDWASIRQCFKILQNYTICYVKPESLDISPITEKFEANIIESFPDHFFKGISGYNRLMLSSQFYNRFKEWKYIFIYQYIIHCKIIKINYPFNIYC